jgi:hypothetical protein
MIPNIQIHEQLMFERHQALQREMEQRRLLAGLPRYQFKLARRFAATVGELLIGLGSSLKRLEVSEQRAYGQ